MCYILIEKHFDNRDFFRKFIFAFKKKIKNTKAHIGKNSYNIKVITAKLSKQKSNRRTIKRIIRKIKDNQVILQINSDLKRHFIEKGMNIVDRRGYFKRNFNKLAVQLLKTMDLDPAKLRSYIITEDEKGIDYKFIGDLCLLSNQLCICKGGDLNIDDICEDIYENLGASLTTANISDLTNKNGIYFVYSSDENIVRKLKKTSSDKLIFSYCEQSEYSSKNKTIIDGAYFNVSPQITNKLPSGIDTTALISLLDEENALDFSDISLKCFTSGNLEVTLSRLMKMKLLDS